MSDAGKAYRHVKCLLVDDLPENLLALNAVLRSDEVEILEARSGAEALELLLAHDFALALLDVQMPGMDGFELAELMRGTERTRLIPIIFLTAASRDHRRAFKGYEIGAVDFLYKPIEPEVVKSKAEVFFQLCRQKQQIAAQLANVAEVLRFNETFTAILGHDLRNPLNAVLIGAELIGQRSSDETVRRAATRIQSSAQRMARMIDDLLDLSRCRLGAGITTVRKQTELGEVVQAVVLEHPSTLERRIEFTRQGNLVGEWDGDRLSQVASNLIGNALTHGEPHAAIEVTLDGTKPDGVRLTVKNAGVIPRELWETVFDPFKGSRRDGLGLGLYITQQIVVSHQGKIELESGEGATAFRIWLPRK